MYHLGFLVKYIYKEYLDSYLKNQLFLKICCLKAWSIYVNNPRVIDHANCSVFWSAKISLIQYLTQTESFHSYSNFKFHSRIVITEAPVMFSINVISSVFSTHLSSTAIPSQSIVDHSFIYPELNNLSRNSHSVFNPSGESLLGNPRDKVAARSILKSAKNHYRSVQQKLHVFPSRCLFWN